MEVDMAWFGVSWFLFNVTVLVLLVRSFRKSQRRNFGLRNGYYADPYRDMRDVNRISHISADELRDVFDKAHDAGLAAVAKALDGKSQ
jgi:hypothetical protein